MNNGLAEKVALIKTFWAGFKTFERTGEAPYESWLAMRRLFVVTNGWFNDVFHKFYTRNRRPSPIPTLEGSFWKGFDNKQLKIAVDSLNRDGYYVFPQLLDDATIKALLDLSLQMPVVLQSDKPVNQPATEESKVQRTDVPQYLGSISDTTGDAYFDPTNLVASNYRLREQDLLNSELIQQIISDPAIISVAQNYMKSQAIYTTVSMWWTTPFGCESPSSALAQQYHFDMDRVKFIKFFLYLTDVGPNDGPHCFVKGSVSRKPKALQRDGRFSDQEIESEYDRSELLEFCGPRGTLIAEDTRGFHKAKMPTGGNRLLFQVELASCLFGPKYPQSTLVPRNERLKNLIRVNPVLYSNFTPTVSTPEKVLTGTRS